MLFFSCVIKLDNHLLLNYRLNNNAFAYDFLPFLIVSLSFFISVHNPLGSRQLLFTQKRKVMGRRRPRSTRWGALSCFLCVLLCVCVCVCVCSTFIHTVQFDDLLNKKARFSRSELSFFNKTKEKLTKNLQLRCGIKFYRGRSGLASHFFSSD